MNLIPNLPIQNEATEPNCYVLGGGHLGVSVARRLQETGYTVGVVNESHVPADMPGESGDPSELQTLEDAGLSSSSIVIVATSDDSRNLLIAQLVRVHFDVARIVVLTNVPTRLGLLASAGHEPVCATSALSKALVDNV